MATVQLFWDPQGLVLDTLGAKRLLRTTDGDTPYVEMALRLLSIDTPEVHYPGTQRPSRQDASLAQLAAWLQAGQAPVDDDLATYLHPKLATGAAGTLQEQQGAQAAAAFNALLETRLQRPTGRQRNVFLRTADRPFDQYGRLLAYAAPEYSATERAALSREDRATFNLDLVRAGWAATFIIYPSLPSYPDLGLLHRAAQDAQDQGRGAWADPLMLSGYEFRLSVRLYDVTRRLMQGRALSARERAGWISRYAVDITTREIVYPQQYHRIPPAGRLFIEPPDVAAAVGRLNLAPASDLPG